MITILSRALRCCFTLHNVLPCHVTGTTWFQQPHLLNSPQMLIVTHRSERQFASDWGFLVSAIAKHCW